MARAAMVMNPPTEARALFLSACNSSVNDPQGPLLATSKRCSSTIGWASATKYVHFSWPIPSATTRSMEVFMTVMKVEIMVFGAKENCQSERGCSLRNGSVAMIATMQLTLKTMPHISHAHDGSILPFQYCRSFDQYCGRKVKRGCTVSTPSPTPLAVSSSAATPLSRLQLRALCPHYTSLIRSEIQRSEVQRHFQLVKMWYL